jgi:long-subunit acyl-CoA synthetase (AMP-forming)
MNVRDYAAETAQINALVAGDTLPKAFLRTAAANPGVVAVRRMVAESAGGWEETTYRLLRDQVAGVVAGLQAAGLRPGQRMVLMMRNRPEFHVVDLAATFVRRRRSRSTTRRRRRSCSTSLTTPRRRSRSLRTSGSSSGS